MAARLFTVSDLVKFFFKKRANPGLFFVSFRFFSVFSNQTIHILQQCEKMSIVYTAPGFEPTTSQT